MEFIQSREFFLRNPHKVATDVLGNELIYEDDFGRRSGKITEVEVYEAYTDEAAHSFSGKTIRNEALFLEGGHIYLHKIHTHICMDIVLSEKNVPNSVLIRSLEPIEGIEFMRKARNQTNIKNLTTGPGKLTKALGVNMTDNKIDLCSVNSHITLKKNTLRSSQIFRTTRIGISKDKGKLNRYYVKDSEFISRK